jgi:hypothetical protein
MPEIDVFAANLFEEAKRFLEKARDADSDVGKKAFLHAALLMGFSALEAHVNAIADEMVERVGLEQLNALEGSILLERDYAFDKGKFRLTEKLKMYNLIERIEFIVVRFSGKRIDARAKWWSKLHQGIDLRNSLVHPKTIQSITPEQVVSALEGILGVLDAMYWALYKKHFPGLGRKLHSKMDF